MITEILQLDYLIRDGKYPQVRKYFKQEQH
jgi:hypothetical protein